MKPGYAAHRCVWLDANTKHRNRRMLQRLLSDPVHGLTMPANKRHLRIESPGWCGRVDACALIDITHVDRVREEGAVLIQCATDPLPVAEVVAFDLKAELHAGA